MPNPPYVYSCRLTDRFDRRNLEEPFPGLAFLALCQQLQPLFLTHHSQRIELLVERNGPTANLASPLTTSKRYPELILMAISFLDSAPPVRYASAFLSLSPLSRSSSQTETKVLQLGGRVGLVPGRHTPFKATSAARVHLDPESNGEGESCSNSWGIAGLQLF